MKSIAYYDENYKNYIEKTSQLNMAKHYERFELYLPANAHILDLGCGSGRDSKHFYEKGYLTTSVDGSIEMVKFCKTILTTPVIHSTFEDFDTKEKFDGIWASASLLHVSRDKLMEIVQKYISYLKTDGIFYISFKCYENDFEFNNRYFTCFTMDGLKEFVEKLDDVSLLLIKETESIQENNMKWLSLILKKI